MHLILLLTARSVSAYVNIPRLRASKCRVRWKLTKIIAARVGFFNADSPIVLLFSKASIFSSFQFGGSLQFVQKAHSVNCYGIACVSSIRNVRTIGASLQLKLRK